MLLHIEADKKEFFPIVDNLCSQMEAFSINVLKDTKKEEPKQDFKWSITLLKGIRLLGKITLETAARKYLFKSDLKTYFIDVDGHWKQ